MESYLLHDANASSNFKIMMMIQKEGMKGYGIYWMILEFLRVQNGYKADVRIPVSYTHLTLPTNREV